jgi:hypothetical protein
MKYLKTFEFFDFGKYFDIDEGVLSYVFADLLEKYPYIGMELVEVDKENFKIELIDKEFKDQPNDLDDEYEFLKKKDIYTKISNHFDVMNFKIKNLEYKKDNNKIVYTINQLVKSPN